MRFPSHQADRFLRTIARLTVGDLSAYGLPFPEEGVFTRLQRQRVAPSIVDKQTVTAIKDGRIEIVAGVESLDETGVRLADGTRIEPDAVLVATGYRRGLEPVVGHLGVLGDRGAPRATGAVPAAPGLRFVGYVPIPAQLGYIGREAKRAARAIVRDLGRAGDRRALLRTPAPRRPFRPDRAPP